MVIKCNNGNYVERFYDRSTRSSVTRVLDPEGNQIGEAAYSGNPTTAASELLTMVKDNEGMTAFSKRKFKFKIKS